MGKHVQLRQATSLQERAASARGFVAATGLQVGRVVLDDISDGLMRTLSAHPQRFFVVDAAGVLRLKAMPFEGVYALESADRVLAEICG
mmetsp:Transcript_74370/g.168462  ORF Transcript_74370/g.168462 Transcript_74370/m.168462 type:complete len:89 (+) Transcript_74370:996-1262(+)